jgi:hypothetical protein
LDDDVLLEWGMAGAHRRPESVELHDQQLLHLDEWVIRGYMLWRNVQVCASAAICCKQSGVSSQWVVRTNYLMATKLAITTNKHKTVTQCCVLQHSQQFSGHSGWIHWTWRFAVGCKNGKQNRTYPADDHWLLVDPLYSAPTEGWDGWYTGSLSLLGVAVDFCCWPMSWWSLLLSFGLIQCIDDPYLPASEKSCWPRWRHFKRKESTAV